MRLPGISRVTWQLCNSSSHLVETSMPLGNHDAMEHPRWWCHGGDTQRHPHQSWYCHQSCYHCKYTFYVFPDSNVHGANTGGPSGTDRTQVGSMLAPWTLLSGLVKCFLQKFIIGAFAIVVCLNPKHGAILIQIVAIERYWSLPVDGLHRCCVNICSCSFTWFVSSASLLGWRGTYFIKWNSNTFRYSIHLDRSSKEFTVFGYQMIITITITTTITMITVMLRLPCVYSRRRRQRFIHIIITSLEQQHRQDAPIWRLSKTRMLLPNYHINPLNTACHNTTPPPLVTQKKEPISSILNVEDMHPPV